MLSRFQYCPGDGTNLDIFYGWVGGSYLIVVQTTCQQTSGGGISYSWDADHLLTPWRIDEKTPDIRHKKYYIDALIAFLTFIGHTYMGSLLKASPTRREDSPFDDRGFYKGRPPAFLACDGVELPRDENSDNVNEPRGPETYCFESTLGGLK